MENYWYSQKCSNFLIMTKQSTFENSYAKLLMHIAQSSTEELYGPGTLKGDSHEPESSVVWSREQVTHRAQQSTLLISFQILLLFVLLHSLLYRKVIQNWFSSTNCSCVLIFFRERAVKNSSSTSMSKSTCGLYCITIT